MCLPVIKLHAWIRRARKSSRLGAYHPNSITLVGTTLDARWSVEEFILILCTSDFVFSPNTTIITFITTISNSFKMNAKSVYHPIYFYQLCVALFVHSLWPITWWVKLHTMWNTHRVHYIFHFWFSPCSSPIKWSSNKHLRPFVLLQSSSSIPCFFSEKGAA